MDAITASDTRIFPPLTPQSLLFFQFSSWYPMYAAWSMKSTVIRPLGDAFRAYLESDGVFIPEGSEDQSVSSFTLPARSV